MELPPPEREIHVYLLRPLRLTPGIIRSLIDLSQFFFTLARAHRIRDHSGPYDEKSREQICEGCESSASLARISAWTYGRGPQTEDYDFRTGATPGYGLSTR